MSGDRDIAQDINTRLGEWFDCYVVVGFSNDEPFIVRRAGTTKDHLALNSLLDNAHIPIQNGKTESE